MKVLGILIIALSVLSVPITLSLTNEFIARGAELHKTCTLDDVVCPFIVFPWQAIFLFGIAAVLVFMGFLVYRLPKPADEAKNYDFAKARKALETLEADEKLVYGVVIDEGGMVFQGKIIEKTGFTKVKVTRILDSIEHKGLIERKRRGMANVVLLK